MNIRTCPHCGIRGHVGGDGLCPQCRKPVGAGAPVAPAAPPVAPPPPADAFAPPADAPRTPSWAPYLGGAVGAVFAAIAVNVVRSGGVDTMTIVEAVGAGAGAAIALGVVYAVTRRRA